MPIASISEDLVLPVKYLLLYPAEILVLLLTLCLLAAVRVKPAIGWAVGLAALMAIVARTLVTYPEGFDFRMFWEAGCAVWCGQDPYNDVRVLNPPPAPTFYALLAMFDVETSLLLWTCLNLAGCCMLGFMATKALEAQAESPGDLSAWRLAPSALAVLAGVLAFCYACRRNLDGGQLSIMAGLLILAALWAQGRNHPWLAGALLAVAAIKAATWVPFLFLFFRKRDWPTWAAMAMVGLGLSFVATPPGELAARCRHCLENIATLSQPGRVNDYMKFDHINVELIMPEYALFCLGVGNRTIVAIAGGTITIVLGTLLIRWVLGQRVSRPAACALVSIYAAIFLYHRQYDMMLLALPLVYAVGRAQTEKTWTRWLYALSGVAILAVLYFRLPQLEWLELRIEEGGVPWIVRALVMPYCVWALVVALVAMAIAEHRRDLSQPIAVPPNPSAK